MSCDRRLSVCLLSLGLLFFILFVLLFVCFVSCCATRRHRAHNPSVFIVGILCSNVRHFAAARQMCWCCRAAFACAGEIIAGCGTGSFSDAGRGDEFGLVVLTVSVVFCERPGVLGGRCSRFACMHREHVATWFETVL